MESVEEEVFEVQTLQPFHGWTFERFCDRSGNTFPALTHAAQRTAARDDKLNAVLNSQQQQDAPTPQSTLAAGAVSSVSSRSSRDRDGGASSKSRTRKFEIGDLPSGEWMWSHDWLPDVEYTQCDEEGWSYGSTIARINRRLAEGRSIGKREYYHFVRRRRWIRTRVKKPPTASHCGDSSSSSESEDAVSVHRESDLLSPQRYYRVYRDSVLAHFHFRSTPRQPNFVRCEFSDDDVQLEGWLGKRGTFSRSWKLRYFLLRLDRSSLVCLRDRASLVQVCEEFIDRHTSVIAEDSPNPQQFQFLVLNRSRQLRLNAVDAATRAAWLSAISELIVRSRASFFAGDESEANVSVRSRTFRRMQHAASLDFDDDLAASGYGANTGTGPSTFFHPSMSFDPGTGGNGTGAVKKKTRRRAWRPYKLVSATMHSRLDTDRLRRFDYFERFRKDLRARIETVDAFVNRNIDILEENLEAAEQLLSSAVASVPTQDIAQLRRDVADALEAFDDTVATALAAEHANVLSCNRLARDLYLLAKRLNELVLSFAPPVAQATVKKVLVESPTKRRIPEDWFTEPKDYAKPSQRSSTSALASASSRSDSMQSTSTSTTATATTRGPGARADKASLAKSFPDAKALSTSRRTSNSDQTATASRYSATSTALSGSEPIRIKAYVEMPSVVNDGHFELPSGVNDYVIQVHDKDLGALIGFTLCSKAYVDELESHFSHTIDIAKELAVEERASFVRVEPGALSTSADAVVSMRVSKRRRALYLAKMRSNDVQHTDMKFAYDANATTHSIRCITFFAAQFHALRALQEPGNLQFLNSIAESRRWDTSGGKSGAFFSMTHDKRYVLKGISLTEFNMFLHMAPHYFKFLSHVLELSSPTVMTKILGLFKLSHSRRLHKQTTYVVVMENLAFGCSPGQMYDIKGILRRRYDFSDSESDDDERESHARRRTDNDDDSFHTNTNAGGGDRTRDALSSAHVAVKLPVLLDGNLAERIPIPVRQSDLDVINQAIQNDTGFLCRAGVIDYSILMLFDEDRREVVFGLIDYLHQFDFLKKMESTSKAGLTFRNPTVISPVSYRRRFVNAMHRYLVGIEEELELRMRKRCYPPRGKKPGATAALTSTVLQGVKGLSGGDSGDGRESNSSSRQQQQRLAQDSCVSAQLAISSSVSYDVGGGGSGGGGGGGYDSNAPTSASSFAESVTSAEPQSTATTTFAAPTDANLELVLNASRRRGRSLSHISLGHDAMPYDFDAGKAHSDGEDFSSASSDDNCLKGSQAIIDAMLPEFDD